MNPNATSQGPWYIVFSDPKTNMVFACNNHDNAFFTAARTDQLVALGNNNTNKNNNKHGYFSDNNSGDTNSNNNDFSDDYDDK